MLKALVIALIIIVIYFYFSNRKEFVKVKSNHDGMYYNVLEDYKNKQDTADTMAKVNTKMLQFLAHLKEKYHVNMIDPPPPQILANERARQTAVRIVRNYDFEKLFETHPTGKNGTSYTIEKGQELHMCVRGKDDLKLHDEHDIMFVALHELAHIGNPTWGHKKDYWEVFKFVLGEAKEAGVHDPRDYRNDPIVYCGLTVDYNPYYDTTLKF